MKLFLLALLSIALFSWAGIVDEELSNQMAQDPQAKIHVIAFFQKQVDPFELMETWNVRGDNLSTRIQVVNIYKMTAEEAFFWFKQSWDQRSEIQGLTLHEILQGFSFTATAETIQEVANRSDIGRVALFTPENTKPNDFFLNAPYYQIQSMEVVKTGDDTDTPVAVETIANREGDINYEQIINILKKLYEFVKENQPVVNTSIDQASAVPQGINTWQQMAGWRELHTGQYSIIYKNLYGIEVVRIVVRAHFYHSGNYQGIGRYITCATTSIDELNVLWGYTLTASVKIPDSGIVNIGTSQNPVAGMKMFINWTVKTILQQQQGTLTFSLDGNGNISGY